MTLRLVRLWLVPGLLASAAGLQAQVPPSATTHPAPPIVAPVAPAKPKNDDMVDSFKVADLDIDAVLGALETFTGMTIIRPGTLPTSTYSLRINRPISKAELVIALETILELNNVSVSPMGDRFLKVTPLAQAKSEAPEMILGSSLDLPPSGKVVSKIFELTFLRTSEFVPQIQSFMTPGIAGGLVQLEKANVVLVTDTLENVQRVERLLLEVDKPREGSLVPKFYVLHNGAKAADVVGKIHSMISGAAANQLRATTSVTADDRTNQIIVIADAREYPLFDSLIEQLDIKSDPYTRMEVIPLKHGDAKDVATLLSSLITGQTSAAKASQSVRPGQITVPGQAVPATPGAPAAAAVSQPNSEGPASSEFSSFITIQPDERTNSVVVSGTFDDIRLIKGIVDKIDVLLAQVSIQVVIAEVSLSDTDQNGIQALNLTVGPAANGGTSITNFSGSITGWNVTSGIVNPLSFVAALQSAGDKHKVKILQQDTITTTHNKQASFVVSEQLPIITGTTGVPLSSGTAGSFATSSTVTYQDIGITLKVTPLIGDDGSVQLQIDQKVDSNEGSVTIDGNDQPIIGHREATSFINVMDGQMAVLGGLQSSGLTQDKQKLGLLYELPIISNLFGGRKRDLERTELLLFIRPHVLRPDEATGETRKQIEGMSNSGQIQQFLKDTTKMPDPKETLREKLD
ncbi:MAG TPA: secretin N-terminal domain-containing protein [Opitutaceae bacterium]